MPIHSVLLDTRRTISTGLGRSIYLQGESQNSNSYEDSAGDAIIAGGDWIYSYGGKITLAGAQVEMV